MSSYATTIQQQLNGLGKDLGFSFLPREITHRYETANLFLSPYPAFNRFLNSLNMRENGKFEIAKLGDQMIKEGRFVDRMATAWAVLQPSTIKDVYGKTMKAAIEQSIRERDIEKKGGVVQEQTGRIPRATLNTRLFNQMLLNPHSPKGTSKEQFKVIDRVAKEHIAHLKSGNKTPYVPTFQPTTQDLTDYSVEPSASQSQPDPAIPQAQASFGVPALPGFLKNLKPGVLITGVLLLGGSLWYISRKPKPTSASKSRAALPGKKKKATLGGTTPKKKTGKTGTTQLKQVTIP